MKKYNSIKEPTVSEAHPTLFHYTTETGLYGILESQQLWATHFAHLNDSLEIKAAKGVLESALFDSVSEIVTKLVEENKIQIQEGITLEELCDLEAKNIVDIFYRVTLSNVTPFIFSFCTHNQKNSSYADGLLSQWRGYGSDGGFAIEFDSKAIEELLQKDSQTCSHSGFHLSELIYGVDSSDFNFLKDNILKIASVAKKLIPRVLDLDVEKPNIDNTYMPFIECITRMKHPGFSEECEVRLVYIKPEDHTVPNERLPGKEIGFRHRSGVQIPYVRIFDKLNDNLPIKRIIVGPHPKANLRKNSLQLFLSQKGIHAEVQLSSIPYLPE